MKRSSRQKQKEWQALGLRGKRFIAYHKLFEYLAPEFGIEFVGYVEPKPGIPPSAGYVEELIEKMRQSKPDGILTTSYYGKKESESISAKDGSEGDPHTRRCRRQEAARMTGSHSWTSVLKALQ